MGGALADSKISRILKQPEIAFLSGGVVRFNFLSIRGRLSCYQQSRPFESWIPGEALPTLSNGLGRIMHEPKASALSARDRYLIVLAR